MKTNIGTSFGLALLLVLGMVTAILAFGLFLPNRAHALVDVTAITATPSTAGATANLSINFRTTVVLTGGSGTIIVKFDKNWGVPENIDVARVTLTTSQSTGGTSNPVAITRSVNTTTSDITLTLTIDDTDSSTTGRQDLNPQASGASATAAHTLTFSPLAKITMPISAGTAAGNFITVSTGGESAEAADGSASPAGVATLRSITLSSTGGANGSTITVTGKGFTNDGTASIFLDADSGDDFDSGEVVLATSDSTISGGEFTATVTVNTTQFSVGNVNSINASDGTGAAATLQLWDLQGSISTTSVDAKRGQSITIKLRQYPAGTVSSVTFGGAAATLTSSLDITTTSSDSSADLVITVPTTTPLGTQRVSVAHTGEATRNMNLEIVGAPLTLSPSNAVPLQTITVSGSGFTPVTNISSITIGASTVPAANIAGNTTVSSDDSGNIVATVKIDSNATTRSAGTHTLTVTDSQGRTGQATLTIPSRSITVTPDSSRRASTVSYSGSGFPASSTVTLTYLSGTTTTTLGSITPDSSGGFSATFTVPTGAGIPSTNTVTGTSAASGTPSATATHKVPGATVTVAETSVTSGTNITVSGEGFPGFSTMTALTIGGVSAIPTPAPATNVDGVFSTPALVPQLATGTQAILVTIGGISANSSVTVTATPVVVTPTTTGH